MPTWKEAEEARLVERYTKAKRDFVEATADVRVFFTREAQTARSRGDMLETARLICACPDGKTSLPLYDLLKPDVKVA